MAKWDWTQNGLFFLTKMPVVEITTVGGGHDDVDFFHDGCLYLFGDQCVGNEVEIDGIDRWGRNFTDRAFVAICDKLWLATTVGIIVFHSLTTRQDGDKYLVRICYDDLDLEMEVAEMFQHCCNLVNSQRTTKVLQDKFRGNSDETPAVPQQ